MVGPGRFVPVGGWLIRFGKLVGVVVNCVDISSSSYNKQDTPSRSE